MKYFDLVGSSVFKEIIIDYILFPPRLTKSQQYLPGPRGATLRSDPEQQSQPRGRKKGSEKKHSERAQRGLLRSKSGKSSQERETFNLFIYFSVQMVWGEKKAARRPRATGVLYIDVQLFPSGVITQKRRMINFES